MDNNNSRRQRKRQCSLVRDSSHETSRTLSSQTKNARRAKSKKQKNGTGMTEMAASLPNLSKDGKGMTEMAASLSSHPKDGTDMTEMAASLPNLPNDGTGMTEMAASLPNLSKDGTGEMEIRASLPNQTNLPGLTPGEIRCVVCLDTVNLRARKSMRCGHEFHEICINRWLRCKKKCPICRISVNGATNRYHPEINVFDPPGNNLLLLRLSSPVDDVIITDEVILID